jgi:hypothetical protein
MKQNSWKKLLKSTKKISSRLLALEKEKYKEVLPSYIQDRLGHYKELCEDVDHKYIITIDGWTSPWFRGPMLLKSNSVPIVVMSKASPLYFDAWEPYVHYVPVKHDLSDLIEQITWLQENDEIAFEIAQNGNDLYEKLYTYENMQNDTLKVFTKYGSLMKYSPKRPDAKHII